MLQGYRIAGEDNDSFRFSPDDKNLTICTKCKYITNFDYFSPCFKLKKKLYDYSHTYDGGTIVSQKFKDFCIRENYKGLVFEMLPNNNNYYFFKINNFVIFDKEKQPVKCENYCDECNNYESITVSQPHKLKINNPLDDGFFASDLVFASGNEKHHVHYIGVATYKKMKKEKFKGIYYFKLEL